MKHKSSHKFPTWLIVLGVIGAFLFIVIPLVVFFLIKPVQIAGRAMEPNYRMKEYYLTDRQAYLFATPKRSDVVVYRYNFEGKNVLIISRVIGIPGDRIETRNGELWINGQKLDEPYLELNTKTTIAGQDFNRVLSDQEYFVLGDNREHSMDSRKNGPIKQSDIKGKVTTRYWPIERVEAKLDV